MAKKNVMTIRIPEELKSRIERVAVGQGVSINQFALYAFTKELGELETSRYFREVLKGKKAEDIAAAFDMTISKIQERKTEEWDRV